MRLVVDLQACQTDSRDRGIGRYVLNLVEAIARELDAADSLIIAIDMGDVDRARDVRSALRLKGVRGEVVAYGYPVTSYTDSVPPVFRLAGKLRANFFASLCPDVLLICSPFETGGCYTTELDWPALRGVPVAVICFDLIPLIFSYRYLPAGHVLTQRYRQRLTDLPQFDLILSISDTTRRDLIVHIGVDRGRVAVIGAGFDKTLECARSDDWNHQRLHELDIENPFVLMVGNGDWRKNTLGAIRAFAGLPEPLRDTHDLVLTQVGSDVRHALETTYAQLRDHIHVLGRVDDATLALLYGACKVFYFPSYYEGFGLPVLEAMAFDAPVLSSNAGSLPEVVHDERVLFDPHVLGAGAALLSKALADDEFRAEIRRGARDHALGFTWQRTARLALEQIRALALRGPTAQGKPIRTWSTEEDIALMADACVSAGAPGELALENALRTVFCAGKRRVLVDMTEMTQRDAGTGIHRVTRTFFEGLSKIACDTRTFDVEPIRCTDQGIVYAREFARDRLGVACPGADTAVQVEPSDLVFMLDATWPAPERFDDLHARVHAAGGEVIWMMYDLVPIRFPETCNPIVPPAFETWLAHAVRSADGFVCISDATRTDLESYVDDVITAGVRRPWTRTVRLGCDPSTRSDSHAGDYAAALMHTVGSRSYFTALSTIEPRKDYKTILDAFDLLWARGVDVALVIIGKQGWNVDALVERIHQHPEYDRRLFWLQGVSDGDVCCLLKDSSALIQASIAEGFGLPLIEAGRLGVPLLASDIPVFHEVAGDNAVYFPVGDAAVLADLVNVARDGESARRCTPIPSRSWHEASMDLVTVLGVGANCRVNP